MADVPLEQEIEARIEALGLELVKLERAGDQRRPILRVYVDRPDSVPGQPGVSLEECAAASRALEPHLDARGDLSDRYVLEVSSPGVERPLVRRRDWERFAGQPVALRGRTVLAERARKLEGTLLGRRGDDRVALRLEDGQEVEVPLADVEKANLVYRWEKGRKRP